MLRDECHDHEVSHRSGELAGNDLPKNVVRFYGNVDFAMDTISNRRAIFVHVSKLNDPFDPYLYFETDFAESQSALLEYAEKFHPNHNEWFKQHVTKEKLQKTINEIRALHDKVVSATFVFCVSAPDASAHPCDNLYLWGHYGNGHRGVAIEFDTHELATPLIGDIKNTSHISESDVWLKMEYLERYPPITCREFFEHFKSEYEGIYTKTLLESHYDKLMRVKSTAWSQENEWRLVWQNHDTRSKTLRVPISDSAIKAVYIGKSTSEANAEAIEYETKQKFPSARVFRGVKRHGHIKLDFELL